MSLWSKKSISKYDGVRVKTLLSKRDILSLLYYKKELNNRDISKRLHISFPTVSLYTDELVEAGYVKRAKGAAASGRKPSVFSINGDTFYFMGVDIGNTFLNIGIYNADMQLIEAVHLPPVTLHDKEKGFAQLLMHIQNFLTAHTSIVSDMLVGVGVSMPGIVDAKHGINHTHWYTESVSLCDELAKELACEVFLDNDTNVRALAEMRFGALVGVKNGCLIQIDLGLGLGMTLDGKIHYGHAGLAGEFGCIPVAEAEANDCNCSKVGCLETIASGQTLVRQTKEELIRNPQASIKTFLPADHDYITPRHIVSAALAGDHFALTIIQDLGVALGKGVAVLIHILGPEKVVLAGAVADAGPCFINAVSETMTTYCTPLYRDNITVANSELGRNAGILGAALMAIERLLAP